MQSLADVVFATRESTDASDPSICSLSYRMGSPVYCSILPMYELAMRLVKRRTNSCFSDDDTVSHVEPSERRDISWKSNRFSATFRISARRSAMETFLTAEPSWPAKT